MSEEKKYSVIGKVEIGTDEYRDLINRANDAEKESDKQRSQWLDQYNKANKLEAQDKSSREKIALYDEYLKSIEKSEAFKAFVVQRRYEILEDEDED